jgi:hypothetical protein
LLGCERGGNGERKSQQKRGEGTKGHHGGSLRHYYASVR